MPASAASPTPETATISAMAPIGSVPPGPTVTPNAPAPVTVRIDGGESFPYVTEDYQIPFYEGMNIAQALDYTGVVQATTSGVKAVGGVRNDTTDDVRIGGGVQYVLRLNGRQIPHSLLSFPVHRRDVIGIELIVIGPS
ncbi:hypothetical protein HGI30_20405 [Paenibacillus albicereus]|uniref:Uncharacterized protein n=1 Tax=Paenibacillus albicereus TaxID=2726185 RepID=A0A6H2H2U6_9BACL|nr:hypothetical protein [Paenibacillus albicereus]QJC53658.1 hypothetical protein HGI30_20405 [Paenibacillus albicereus]